MYFAGCLRRMSLSRSAAQTAAAKPVLFIASVTLIDAP
jgi:hypothetical protein